MSKGEQVVPRAVDKLPSEAEDLLYAGLVLGIAMGLDRAGWILKEKAVS